MTLDLEAAHLKGHIYHDGDKWRCTSHGGAMARNAAGVLEATCCARQVKA